MTKILFFDVETTGLDSKIHGMHQLSGILEIDGEPVKTFDFKINPAPHLQIDQEALKISGKTIDEIRAYPSEAEVYRRFIAMLLNYIDKFNKLDKAFLAGWNNAAFDNGFLRAFFERNGDKYFGSWFWSNPLDVMVLATEYLLNERSTMLNFKLMTVAAFLLGGIDESKLHDATYDIELTRNIYQIVKS
ncbi:MAG: 3'-5' exonuclease [Bacteroidales bacterium]|nr:3'-5' exonuclease [Bacteroidales bacterium]